MKSFVASILLSITFLLTGALVPAFAVSGWASAAPESSQGKRLDNSDVPAIRSNPSAALGVAENDTVEGHFFSLGFGGHITLQFADPVSGGGVFVVEATNLPYPDETANVQFSADGINWSGALGVVQDGQVSVPESVSCAQYVRITDTSNKANFEGFPEADGYDVDGAQLSGDACPVVTPTPTPTPEETITPTPTPDPCSLDNNENENCVTPTPTPTPENPPSNGGGNTGDGKSDGRSDGGSSCPSCTAPPASSSNVLGATTDSGQVLGASTDTLAATGSTNGFMNGMIAASAALVTYLLGYLSLRDHETSET